MFKNQYLALYGSAIVGPQVYIFHIPELLKSFFARRDQFLGYFIFEQRKKRSEKKIRFISGLKVLIRAKKFLVQFCIFFLSYLEKRGGRGKIYTPEQTLISCLLLICRFIICQTDRDVLVKLDYSRAHLCSYVHLCAPLCPFVLLCAR